MREQVPRQSGPDLPTGVSQFLTRPAAMVEPDAFAQLQSYVEKETETLKLLRCKTLKECLLSGKESSKRDGNPKQLKHYKLYLALQNRMSAEQTEVLEDWGRTYCLKERPMQQQFDRFIKMHEENRDELKAMQKSTLLELMCVVERTGTKEHIFGRNFCRRSYEKLDEDMKAMLQEWEAQLCVASVCSIDKFVEILDRRKVELQSFAAASVESLFNVHAKKQDAELRCCYDFMQRTFPSLTEETKEMLTDALRQLLPASATVPLKKSHEAKLHSRETVLGDNLPRPRLPKSLRQLYGNSADAESRAMAFFHRVNEVDTFLNELEFQDCSYCHEGRFDTKRTKAQLPGKFETQTFQKTNFVQMPKKDWLEPERPICDM